jgi:hypothetical protein
MTGWILAFATASTRSMQGVFIWSGALVALTLLAFAGYSALRRWMRSMDEPPGEGNRGFTLADLRDLHRQGKMTDAEYEATRAQLVGAAKRMVDQLPPVMPRTPVRRPPPNGPPPTPPAD